MPAETSTDGLAFLQGKDPASMSLVEIAQELEQVTSWIESQRVRERDARAAYQQVATQVESNIARIRDFAKALVDQQRSRMNSFSGLLGQQPQPEPRAEGRGRSGGGGASSNGVAHHARPGAAPKNLAEAIIAIWSLDKYGRPLTTEEIGAALPEIGYKSDAAPTSLKSSVNQALAKLCRVGRVVRFRADGSRIPIRDTRSRARMYLAATRLPEGEE
jgi:hypothetical protein